MKTIAVQPHFSLPEAITPSTNAPALPKSLYRMEGGMGKFETSVINQIANLDNVLWWHRNLSRGKGFCINGFINHYPDFIVHTKSGRTIIVEAKGDDRDNSDSNHKIKLGREWAARAGDDFRYMMVYEKAEVAGAHTLVDAVRVLGRL